MQQRKS